MEVKAITILSADGSIAEIRVVPLGNRLYRICDDLNISIYTDNGTFRFFFKAGFVTNFRSGGILIDRIIDQIGDLWQQCAYLCHDAAYTPCSALNMEHPLSREVSDELLQAVLVYAGMGRFKASLVFWSVRLLGGPAYSDDDELTSSNAGLFTFEKCA